MGKKITPAQGNQPIRDGDDLVLGQATGGQRPPQPARRLNRRGPAVPERGRLALALEQSVDEAARVVPGHVAVNVGLEGRLMDPRLAALEDVLEVLTQEAPAEEVVLFAVGAGDHDPPETS